MQQRSPDSSINNAHPGDSITNNDVTEAQQSSSNVDTDQYSQSLEYMRILKSNVKVLKRIPKAGRLCASQSFKVLESVIQDINSFEAWFRLISFAYAVFKAPDRRDKATSKLSLATCVQRNLKFWNEIKNLAFFDKIVPTKINQRKVKKKLDADEA